MAWATRAVEQIDISCADKLGRTRKLMNAIVIAAWALFLPELALAQDDLSREIARCAQLAGDLDRLACFDRTASEAGLDRPQPLPVPTSGTGDWRISRGRNPIDDSERVTLTLEATSGQTRYGETVTLVARCQSNRTELYINWYDFLGSDNRNGRSKWKDVTIRIGDQGAIRQSWSVSTNNEATFAPDWAGSLLKQMVQSDRFLAQTTPHGENPMTATFDTAGLENALVPLMEACNWSLD